ncbi:heterocycloanthracin/sonorensin family bacteriocin [Ectobacillus panaciterrae]|uniref:heterocycloanthracin/sonorensin family bacteriocin n=1 Tax=Ectobacillus panaciterrae TaxID=363872 RepID=UPI0009D76682|nr:heterocycloanthracin/sonorensin family bacteriocin [Ectobacillus panaciterrae]
MYNFQDELQALNLADFQVSQTVPWDTQNQYYTDATRIRCGGCGGCFRCFRCGGCGGCFRCFSCFQCSGCARCF